MQYRLNFYRPISISDKQHRIIPQNHKFQETNHENISGINFAR